MIGAGLALCPRFQHAALRRTNGYPSSYLIHPDPHSSATHQPGSRVLYGSLPGLAGLASRRVCQPCALRACLPCFDNDRSNYLHWPGGMQMLVPGSPRCLSGPSCQWDANPAGRCSSRRELHVLDSKAASIIPNAGVIKKLPFASPSLVSSIKPLQSSTSFSPRSYQHLYLLCRLPLWHRSTITRAIWPALRPPETLKPVPWVRRSGNLAMLAAPRRFGEFVTPRGPLCHVCAASIYDLWSPHVLTFT